jgi:hypothetical protein
MTHDVGILLSGYMAGVVFGSMIAVTIHRIILKREAEKQTGLKGDRMQEQIAQ